MADVSDMVPNERSRSNSHNKAMVKRTAGDTGEHCKAPYRRPSRTNNPKRVCPISYPVGRQTSSAMSLMDAMSSTPYPLAFIMFWRGYSRLLALA